MSTCQQDYVEQMRQHLDLTPNPFDARIELVMPGIQERFNGLRTSVQHMQNSNLEFQSTIQDAIKSLASSRDQQHKEVVTLFHDMHSNMNNLVHAQTQGMRTTMRLMDRMNVFQSNRPTNLHDLHGSLHGTTQDPTRMNLRDHVDTNTEEIAVNVTDPSHRAHPENEESFEALMLNSPRLSQRFSTLSLMWDEWHGIGGPSTKDRPIPGGFRHLEEKYKTKWRQHLQGAQLRHFTRVRLVIEGITKMAETNNVAEVAVRDDLEREWKRMKQSPDAMVKFFQEKGYLKKSKPRGRNASTNQE